MVVVLGGGGAKAAAHLGAAIGLRNAGITPVHWVGTSMGSVIAAAMAGGADPSALLAEFTKVRNQDVLQREGLALLKGIWAPAIFRSDTFRATLERLITPRSFADLLTPCTITAVERDTGKLVTFGAGGEDAPLLDVLAASCALPPWFRPVTINGRAFYDGGIRAPLPLPAAEGIDCDIVLAIDVGPGFDELGTPLTTPPPLMAAADTAIGWLMAGTTALLRERWLAKPGRPRLVYLRPTHDRGATFAIDRIAEYGRLGIASVQQAIGELS